MSASSRSGKDKKLWFMRNGKMLLEESVTLFDGKINHIRQFSAAELKDATKNFNPRHIMHQNRKHILYRNFMIDGRAVIVKKYIKEDENICKEIIREIVIASRMSVHKNVLKLIGCCLEMKAPILIFESIDCDGTLDDHLRSCNGDERRPLAWKDRLKIAADVSNLVAYLHTALPRPFIHRSLTPSAMLLDKDCGVAKLFDFLNCVPLPEGKSFIKMDDVPVVGKLEYVDPETFSAWRFNEQVDVYSFGVTLLVLLSGRKPFDSSIKNRVVHVVNHARQCVKNKLFEQILDPILSEEEPWPGNNMQFKAFLKIALKCTRRQRNDRPDITNVARQLREMYRSLVFSS